MHMTLWWAMCTYMHMQMHSSQQRRIIQKTDHVRASRHTHKWDRHANGTHWDWKTDSPLAREPILSITLHPTRLTHVTQNQPPSPTHPHVKSPFQFSTHHIRPQCTLCVCVSLPCIHTSDTHWDMAGALPHPWTPPVISMEAVCVCLASNGPFKCRIFTADRAILGDSTQWGLNMLGLHYPGGSYPYYHHTMPHWLAMSWFALALSWLCLLFMFSKEGSLSQHYLHDWLFCIHMKKKVHPEALHIKTWCKSSLKLVNSNGFVIF